MKTRTNKANSIISGILLLLVSLLFIASMALGYVYFTVYQPDNFIDGVNKNVDTEYVRDNIEESLVIVSKNYSFESDPIIEASRELDIKLITDAYIKDIYYAFIEGEQEAPMAKFDNPIFYDAITKNVLSSERAEIYKIPENREMLAQYYAEAVEYSVSAFSHELVYKALLIASNTYTEIIQIGKYFTPVLLAFVIFLVLYLVTSKELMRSLYSLALSLLTCSFLFTIPFAYLTAQDLITRFNVDLGAGFAYMDAIWKFMFNDALSCFTVVTVCLALFFIAVVLALVSVKKESK